MATIIGVSCLKKMNEHTHVGGQAVIEGVMMRGKKSLAVAVRKPNNEIIVKKEQLNPIGERFPILKRPVLRGVAVLLESLIWGIRALTFSANEALEEDEEQKEETQGKQELGKLALALTMIFSIGMGIGLFVVLPALISGWITKEGFLFNVIDGLLRLVIFLGYVLAISRIKEITRVFQYHGAEHKSIHAYEAGEELTPENAQKYSPVHTRCGTAFLLMVMVISILFFALLGRPDSILVRIGSRILLIPLIAGISYEITKFASKKQNSRFMRIIVKPGLLLQRLTAKEPSIDQIQVAIRSLQEVLAMEVVRGQEGE